MSSCVFSDSYARCFRRRVRKSADEAYQHKDPAKLTSDQRFAIAVLAGAEWQWAGTGKRNREDVVYCKLARPTGVFLRDGKWEVIQHAI